MSCESIDIAIIGMAGLFPGAGDKQTFWSNILNKVYSITDAPDEWVGPYYDPTPRPTMDPTRIYTRQVGLLGELSRFNPLEFGIPPKHSEGAPGHYLALKLARDTLQDAGYSDRPFNREKTGIILGQGVNPNRADAVGYQYGMVIDQTVSLLQQLLPHLQSDTLQLLRKELTTSLPEVSPDMCPGLVSNTASGRIANRLDLMGPNFLIDAACSSTLIAIDLAIKELVSGNCDMMLAGGVQGTMAPQVYQLFCQLQALSREAIRPFAQNANGTLLSEGVGFFALKRLPDAVQAGDRIYAVIKGIGLSSDGKALGLLAPRLEGEILAIQRAYAQTGLDPDSIELIEAHGTGIPLGDQTEIKALTHVFGQRQGPLPRIALGSVKSMIGHCIPASGVASVIKTAFALHYKTLPPTLCEAVNPALGIEETPFYINTEPRPWIHSEQSPRRAAVNAFGFGGINAHLILEEYREPERHTVSVVMPSHRQQPLWRDWPSELFVFCGHGDAELTQLLQQVLAGLDRQPILADLAYTLAQRPVGIHRLAIVAKTIEDLRKKLTQALEKLAQGKTTWGLKKAKVYATAEATPVGDTALVFSSEGAQYPNMLADLCLYFPQVRAWFDFLDETFSDRATLPKQILFPAPTGLTADQQTWVSQQLYAGDLATESIFAASMALNELLRDCGLQAEVVLGHSAGENVAGRACGVAAYGSRSQFIEQLRHLNTIYAQLEATNQVPTGILFSIGAVTDSFIHTLLQDFAGSLFLVADNCPSQAIVFAQPDVSQQVSDRVQAEGGLCIPLPFNRAYHTPLFTTGVNALRSHYQQIDPGESEAQLYSCSTAAPYPADLEASRSIAAEQWAKPVLFRETIQTLYERGVRTFIEVGPSSNLTAFVDNILRGRDYVALASNSQRQSSLEQMQDLLAQLFVQGRVLNFAPLYQHRPVTLIDWTADPSVAESKGEITLNHHLPGMSLQPEFVKTIRDRLIPPVEEGVPPSIGKSPVSPPPAEGASVVSANSEPSPPINLSAALSVPAPDHSVIEPKHSPPEFWDGEDASTLDVDAFNDAPDHLRLQALDHHFELMQAFLLQQGRIAATLFDQSESADLSNGDQG
jgi:acyl transferase domain-containing protein